MIIRTIEALFTIKSNAGDFRKATSEVDRFAQNASNVLGAIAGHFAFQAITGFVTESAKAMAEVGKSAGLLWLATDALQEMHFAAQKSGVAIDTLDDSLKELQIRAVDSLSGSGEAFDAFNKLKVNPKDLFGRIRAPLDILDEVADKLNQLPTQSERIWVVDSMFGDQGAEMLKMLKGGSQGLANMRAEARSLGAVLSQDGIGKAEKFSASLERMKMAAGGVHNSLIVNIIPGLTKTMDVLAKMSASMHSSGATATLLRMAVVGLGTALVALAIKAGIALCALNPMTAAIGVGLAGLSFVVADLWSAFDGGPSVFKSLHQSARAFFEPIEQWLLDMPKKVLAVLSDVAQKIPGLIAGMLPDFLKDGFSGSVKSASKVYHHMAPLPLNSRMAPQPSNLGPNRLTSNQSVNVAVNVKSGANPQEIGGEVSKAVRKELERERFNAFMGVSQYAS